MERKVSSEDVPNILSSAAGDESNVDERAFIHLEVDHSERAEDRLIHSELDFYLPLLGDTLIGDPDSPRGVLLVHGFTGSNLELLYLGNYLATKGYRVLIVLLQGHGTDYEDLRRYGTKDWVGKIVDCYKYLVSERNGRRVIVGGHSLGGVLVINSLRHISPAGVILMASPIRYPIPLRIFIGMMGRTRRKRYYAGFRFHNKRMLSNPLIKFFDDRYEYVYYSSIREVFQAMDKAYKLLPELDLPMHLIYGVSDYRVPKSQPLLIQRRVRSHPSITWIERTDHVIVIDTDYKLVVEAFENFCNSVLPG